jgi:hypothetical protein
MREACGYHATAATVAVPGGLRRPSHSENHGAARLQRRSTVPCARMLTMHNALRTLIVSVLATAFIGYADFSDAASKKKRKPAPPSSYAPGPSNQRVYGAPIQGAIVSSAASRTQRAKADFQKIKPCPANGQRSGTCPGYTITYVKALNKGGANTPSNMQWKATQVAKAKSSQ